MNLGKSSIELAQKHPLQFFEQVFTKLYVDDFKFGPGESGNLGLNMISQYVVMPAHTLPGGLKPVSEGNELAIHLNCIVKPSALHNNNIAINVQQFHLTVRSLATQKKIDAHGPSIITADNSIHLNVNSTQWGRAENLKALAQEVGINQDQTLRTEVGRKQGYNNAYMVLLLKTFRAKVEHRITSTLEGTSSSNGMVTRPSSLRLPILCNHPYSMKFHSKSVYGQSAFRFCLLCYVYYHSPRRAPSLIILVWRVFSVHSRSYYVASRTHIPTIPEISTRRETNVTNEFEEDNSTYWHIPKIVPVPL
ncbi:hypothetical protein JVU11DRAFT_5852 [Chiua virens]|nr:hypothetical protein JVU11DRAFT_5852 [Chiua virens]